MSARARGLALTRVRFVGKYFACMVVDRDTLCVNLPNIYNICLYWLTDKKSRMSTCERQTRLSGASVYEQIVRLSQKYNVMHVTCPFLLLFNHTVDIVSIFSITAYTKVNTIYISIM